MMMRSQPPSLTPPVFSPLLRSRARYTRRIAGAAGEDEDEDAHDSILSLLYLSLSRSHNARAQTLCPSIPSPFGSSAPAGLRHGRVLRPRRHADQGGRGGGALRAQGKVGQGASRGRARAAAASGCGEGPTGVVGRGVGRGVRFRLPCLKHTHTHTHTHTSSLFKIIGVHRKLQIDSQTSVKMFERVTH